MYLTSLNNEKVKYFKKLLQKKYRDEYNLFLVEDEHLVSEAIKLNLAKEIITTNDVTYSVPTYVVTNEIMKELSNQVTSTNVIAVCEKIKEKEVNGNVIILDDIQDPGNLGTILRSAVAFDFPNVILSNNSVDVYNPKVIRASEGMIFHLNIIRCDIKEFLNNLDKKYMKITTSVTMGEDIKNIKGDNYAIVIGNEGNGVSDEVSSLCDKKAYIKMDSNCESLNAGVSASILMYEVYHE